MKYLGIDHGSAKIGLALGDDEVKVATPFMVIKNSETILRDIAALVDEEGVGAVVVGVPKGLSGNLSTQAQTVLGFISELRTTLSIPVIEENEVLSTAQAQKLTQGSGKADDDVAAMLVLQSYLDRSR